MRGMADSATQAGLEMESLEGDQSQPEMTEQELRSIKKQLRSMQRQAEDDNTDPSRMRPEDLMQNLTATDKLFSKLKFAGKNKNSSLAVIDSKIMTMHSDTAMKLGKQARAEANSFEPGDFFDPLREMLGLDARMLEDVDMEDEDRPSVRKGGKLGDWAKIGWLAAGRSHRAPGVEFMNGMMAIEHKKRVINRKAKQKQQLQPEVRPQEIRQEDMTKAANPTITNTNALAKLLEQQDGETNLFNWLIHPTSFPQTVENAFYTSFLVREGFAAIEESPDGSGIPIIYSCEPPAEEDRRAEYDEAGNEIREALAKRQVIMEMTMDVWEDAIELFNIKKGIIPSREEDVDQNPTASGWYA